MVAIVDIVEKTNREIIAIVDIVERVNREIVDIVDIVEKTNPEIVAIVDIVEKVNREIADVIESPQTHKTDNALTNKWYNTNVLDVLAQSAYIWSRFSTNMLLHR